MSVLGSEYPVVTVILAQKLLGERVSRPQAAGIALALIGVGIVSVNWARCRQKFPQTGDASRAAVREPPSVEHSGGPPGGVSLDTPRRGVVGSRAEAVARAGSGRACSPLGTGSWRRLHVSFADPRRSRHTPTPARHTAPSRPSMDAGLPAHCEIRRGGRVT